MTEANAQRGEVAITLDGVDYVMRPSNTAIDAIEAATDTGIVALVRQAQAGAMRKRTAAIIVTECLHAQGRAIGDAAMQKFDRDRIGELIVEAPGGLLGCYVLLVTLLGNAATGGYTAKGEVKAAAGEKAGESPTGATLAAA